MVAKNLCCWKFYLTLNSGKSLRQKKMNKKCSETLKPRDQQIALTHVGKDHLDEIVLVLKTKLDRKLKKDGINFMLDIAYIKDCPFLVLNNQQLKHRRTAASERHVVDRKILKQSVNIYMTIRKLKELSLI